MSKKHRKARPAPTSPESIKQKADEKRMGRIVDATIGRVKRRGLPPEIDAKDLRQDGMLKAHEILARYPGAPNALLARCVRNRVVDVIRERLSARPAEQAIPKDQRNRYSGITRIIGWELGEDGNFIRHDEAVWNDPFFLLSLEALEAEHFAWEKNRELWAGDIERRAKRWRRALANSPVGDPPMRAA